MQQQARALGDPTRHAIFSRIAEAEQALGVSELTEHFGLNHNAIRQHLAKLVAAELVLESKAARTGPGRPPLVYAVNPAVEGQWGTTGPYERLSRLLVEIISSDRPAAEVGRRAAGRFRVPSPSGDVVADVAAAMARHGFEPEVREVAGGAEVVLHRCPFASAALDDRRTVCALHLGLAEGLAEGSGAVVEELVANDPRTADCRLRLRFETDGSDGTEDPDAGLLTLRGPQRTR